jgi:hypothetical protein|tara:strand:+ start:47 stop:457 length:411 start_codon:yes stop_codon:yes gene_type:complete
VNTLVISCSGSKHSGTRPALELYRARQFTLARELAARPGWRVMILSAEHGLVDGAQELECYDRRMTPARAGELAETAPANYPTGSGPVYVYGGMPYRAIVRAWARDLGETAPLELTGRNRGNGDHYHALAELAARQ